ncbi:hypothetical protein, partial [Bacteroides sp.]|uniref:hypothetical protein n=1 Tax=Bacteroides sp. TaxID=29523 RepID=UPI0025B832E0
MKSRHTEETAQYLLTLIPDKDYYRSHKGSISNSFHHTGEKNGYSGLVVYTHVVTSKIMAVGKYHDGILVSNVFLPSGKKTSESRISVAKALLDGILIPKFKLSASRSFGEEEIEIPGCIFCGQDACGCLVIVDDCQCGNCDLCGYDTTCFWCGMDPCVCDMYCPWCGMDPCECDDNSSGCGYCGDPNCNGECQDSGGNTGDNDGDDEQNKELNAKIESLNANEELKSRIKNLLDEFDKTQKQLENGWVRDRNTIHSPIEQKQNTLKYDWNNINKSVTEWYHLHPGGSPIPSFSDLITLASKHYNGYLDVDSFSYGIVTYFGATTLVVTSENKFDDFAERMQSNRNSIEILYNEFITDHFDNLTSDTAIEFSKVLDNMDSGLQLIFNSYNQTTKEWNGW